VELEHKAYWALKHANFDLKTVGDHRKLQLNELNELQDQAYKNSLILKEKTKKLHDLRSKLDVSMLCAQVLLFNSRLKIYLESSSHDGPVLSQIPNVLSLLARKKVSCEAQISNFKVNCHRLKHYFGGDMPPLVIPDLQTFPKDK
ncbi:hypothetical protein Tco_0136530, partial [Tanacetum coccineum]